MSNEEAPPTPRPPSTVEAGATTDKVLPVCLEANNMSYVVDVRDPDAKGPACLRTKRRRQILDDVHVKCTPGRMTALMGPSGAGKTTLLDAVAGRLKNRADLGDSKVTVNGAAVDRSMWREIVAYVTQEDNLIPTLSPWEILLFTANMRLPKSLSSAEKEQRVTDLLHELGLTHVKDTLVGTPGVSRGLSGGERKRVNIAGQLISSPSILFLDEPTSGLDSASALSLARLLKSLATKRGLTLLCTIHQPSFQVFEEFDDVLLLSRGRTVYYGAVDGVLGHFESLGFPSPKNTNPADHIISMISVSESTVTDDEARIKILMAAAPNAPQAKAIGDDWSSLKPPTPEDVHGANSFKRLLWLIQRSWRVQLRELLLTRARVAQTIGVGLLVSAVFNGMANDQTGIQDRSGLFFLCAMQFLVLPMFSILNSFQAERPVFIREYIEGLYGTMPYYVSKVVADFPQSSALPLLFTVIVYNLVDLRTDEPYHFWLFFVPMLLMSHAGSALGMTISASTSSVAMAMTVAPALFLPLMLTIGFLVNLENMPVYISWLRWVNPLKPSWCALMLNEFTDLELVCTDEQLVGPTQQCPVTNGDAVISAQSVDADGDYLDQVIYLAILVGLFRVLGAVALKLAVRGARE